MVLPLADELDRQKAEMPRSLIDRMAAKGWFGITIPAEHGGLGLGVFEYCLVSEELARAWLSVGSILARGQGLGTQTLDEERRRALLRKSARGEWIGGIALSEPTAGSDLAGVQTRAVRDGDEWVLTGTKRWAGFALAADFIEVLARTREPEPGEPRSAGLEPFLVVKKPGTFPEGMTGHVIDKIGYHGFLTFELELDGVRVPEGDRLTGLYGDGGADADSGGFASVQRGLNIARVHTAARAVGVARAAVEDCQLYLQERQQFGHPIGEFQALRFALADMSAEVDQARAYWQQVAPPSRRGRGGRERIRQGEAAGHRDGGARHQPGDAAPRWQRLHHRTSGGTLLARRAAHHDLRRNQRDPAADHQRPDAGAQVSDAREGGIRSCPGVPPPP